MQQMLSVELNKIEPIRKHVKCSCVPVSVVCSERTREHSEALVLLPSQTAPTLSALAVPKYTKHKLSHTISACPKWHTAHCVISGFALRCLSTFIAIGSTDSRIAWTNELPDEDVFVTLAACLRAQVSFVEIHWDFPAAPWLPLLHTHSFLRADFS